MPINETAATVITAFDNIPAPAHGLVRDLRVRWALEEIGRDYCPQYLDAMKPKSDGYRDWQPYGQVPAFTDGDQRLFESGAILLYLGEQDERLLPRDPAGRWAATTWLIAALNSVEPKLMQIINLDFFQAGKPWAKDARPSAVKMARMSLASTEKALGQQDWFAGPFSIADIMMTTVLRNLNHTDILDNFPTLTAYKSRAEARPAFQRALADQLSAYRKPAPAEEG
ncbi:glutathione S-transferase family protein [Novosphingobium mangrovi (ex Huang et al. 2023)]|uniref:Glutathione S-transferase family protein n=1 Tax=Novosphingobium mangrovi (ex Huang et al. 2023) TaxID=2976432 RepID=A0ABT2I811_9SPHN|nr:glutathione S-transferase family protein [Novosphingobium mangrovi (ex Huang et al. 2023)]MCT2400960.1 glutathione S-transferase family protein [Novosphingobium mangrovi (ex Huang et al. 2023)]